MSRHQLYGQVLCALLDQILLRQSRALPTRIRMHTLARASDPTLAGDNLGRPVECRALLEGQVIRPNCVER